MAEMSKKEADELLRELGRKFNDSTSEERKEMAMAAVEQMANNALMRAHERGGEEETPVPPFECRVCGSTEYTPLPAKNGRLGPGGRGWITGYECKGCSVMFIDLAKFSNK
jgi:hypothetical protein